MPSDTPEPAENGQVPADLEASPPAFGAGADGADPARPSSALVDDPGTRASGAPPPFDDGPDTTDDPTSATVAVDAQDTRDDPGLLEQVADAVGDLWDDVDDGVT